jgi:hypothetical protein
VTPPAALEDELCVFSRLAGGTSPDINIITQELFFNRSAGVGSENRLPRQAESEIRIDGKRRRESRADA